MSLMLLGCAATEDAALVATSDVTQVALTLRVDAPAAGALVAGPNLLVSGVVVSSTGTGTLDVVYVDGNAVSLTAGRFETFVTRGEGPATVVCSLSNPAETGAVAVAFDVDALVPRVTVTAPARASQFEGTSTVLVQATADDERGIAGVDIWGVGAFATGTSTSATPDGQGGVSRIVDVTSGLSLLEATARDAAGLTSSETVAVITGEFQPASTPVEDAAVLHVGPTAMRTIADAAEHLVDSLDLDTYATSKNPFVDSGTMRIDILGARLTKPTEATFGTAQHRLELGVAANGVELEVKATVTLGVTPSVFDIRLEAERLAVTLPLDISAEDGEFKVTLAPPVFEFVAPVVTVTAQDGSPVPDKGFVEGEILDTLETFISGLATQYGQVPIQKAIKALTEPISVPFLGTAVTIDLSAISASAGPSGLDLRLSGTAFAIGDSMMPGDPGVLRTPGAPLLIPTFDGIVLALSDDLVNTVFHEAWAHGLLAFTIDQALLDDAKAEVDLVAGFLGSLTTLGAATVDPESPLLIDLAAGLPPLLQRDPGSGLLTIALGDASLGFRTPNTTLGTGYLSLFLGVGAESAGDAVTLLVNPVKSAFDLALADPEAKRRAETEIEPFVETLLGDLGPLLSSVLVPFKLPAFAGFQPIDLVVGDGGTNGHYLVISAGLRPLL